MTTEAEAEEMQPQARRRLGPQKLEEAGTGYPLESPEEAQPCTHLEFEPVASGTVGQ